MASFTHYMAGAVAMGYAVAGLFFLRFWRRTGDGLFCAFAGAFGLMALNSLMVEVLNVPRENQSWIYLLRLSAYALIILAIVAKNLRGGRTG